MDISDVWLLKTNTNHFLTISSRVKIKTILYLVLKHWPCYQKSVRLHQAIGKCNHRPWSWYFDHKKTFEYLRRWWEVVNNISWWRESRADAAGADWLGPDSSSLNAWVDLKVLSGQDNEGRCWLTLHTPRYLSSQYQSTNTEHSQDLSSQPPDHHHHSQYWHLPPLNDIFKCSINFPKRNIVVALNLLRITRHKNDSKFSNANFQFWMYN